MVTGPDGRIISVRVKEDEGIIGMRAADVPICAKALDDLARGKRPKNATSVLPILCRQGWLTPGGRITSSGERFRGYWRNRPIIRA